MTLIKIILIVSETYTHLDNKPRYGSRKYVWIKPQQRHQSIKGLPIIFNLESWNSFDKTYNIELFSQSLLRMPTHDSKYNISHISKPNTSFIVVVGGAVCFVLFLLH